MEGTMKINIGRAKAASKKKRAGKALRLVKKQVTRKTGIKDVRLSNNINEKIWEKGGKPPRTIEVELIEEEGYVIVDTAEQPVGRKAVKKAEKKVEEVKEEAAEEAEESEEESEDESEESDETYDLEEELVEVLKEGSISEGKEAVKEMNKADFEKILNFEEAHQNRKGMKKFLRSNMR